VYAVEIALRSSELSSQMAAMRMWLDEQGIESSNFSCRNSDRGMLIRIEFGIAREAEEFAERFSQGSDGLSDR
jgi:hypothetical protein